MSRQVKGLLSKSRDAALTAVANYNNPYLTFRSATYISHMQIAWTAMLLAIAFKYKVTPYQMDRKFPSRYMRVNGRKRCWGIEECVSWYFTQNGQLPMKQNILFLKELRDMIEHDEMPVIDLEVFGECQASLFNFEAILVKEFGEQYALNACLASSIQFSRAYQNPQLKSLRENHRSLSDSLLTFITTFRSSLSTDILESQDYSFKVFLMPNTIANNRREAIAVEFIDYSKLSVDERDAFDKLPHLLKVKPGGGYQWKPLRPNEVVLAVNQKLGSDRLTIALHLYLARYFNVRPAQDANNPEATEADYCAFDTVGKQFVFSQAWVDRLVLELREIDRFYQLYANSCNWQKLKRAEPVPFDESLRKEPRPRKDEMP